MASEPDNPDLLKQFHNWLRDEHDRQRENRAEMAIDEDFYDGIQWTEDEILTLQERGQAPLVYNEVKIACNWVIGHEKRNRIDWRVMPRTADDSEMAEIKTKVMKYVSDTNKIPYVRSQAFKDACVAGIGWIEDSLNMDSTKDILYAGRESWRNVLHDSLDRTLDGSGMRYLFRWRDLDVDIVTAMFPKCKDDIRRHVFVGDAPTDELWYIGEPMTERPKTLLTDFGNRERVRLYECWYRMPKRAIVIRGGAFNGEKYDPENPNHIGSIEAGIAVVTEGIYMETRLAYFLTGKLIVDMPSPFRHNQFALTPIYCYRRERDNLPYGMVRAMRDPQADLNKRMSKLLYLLSTNQIITEVGAFDERGEYTLQDAVEAVNRPDGVVVMRDGTRRFEIRRDYGEAQGQQALLDLNRQFLQSTSGVTDELLGKRTNATSGRAILARQEQGSVTTAGLFDNYRLSVQTSGQKVMSNIEQFYSLPKVIRLTDPTAKGAIEWVSINQPEVQPDGSVRFLNDITASAADFIVDEQDFRSSMREVMFESLNDMIGKIAPLNPIFAISLLDLLIDLADFPGKEAMVERVKLLIAESRGELPHQKEAAASEAQAQMAALQGQMEKLNAEVQEKLAEAMYNKARADKLYAEINAATVPPAGGPPPPSQGLVAAPTQQAVVPQQASPLPQEAIQQPSIQQPVPQVVVPQSFGPSEYEQNMARLVLQMAQIVSQMQGQLQSGAQTQAATAAALEGVAASIDSMSSVVSQAAQAAEKSAEATSGVIKSVEVVAKVVEEVAKSVDDMAESASAGVKLSAEAIKTSKAVADKLAEIKKGGTKIIEIKGPNGPIKATVRMQ